MTGIQIRVVEAALRILCLSRDERKPEYTPGELRSIFLKYWGNDMTDAAIGAIRDAITRTGFFKSEQGA